MSKITDNKSRFLQLLSEIKPQRKGMDRLIDWLKTTDFFTAPASTRYHGAYEGGLLEHSLNVYDAFIRLFGNDGDPKDSVTICTLLHDACKIGFYTVDYRNKKNEQSVWEKVPYYAVSDRFPYGHGEKSVFLIERFIRLKNDEALAIRWHMGGFDEASRGGSFAISEAYSNYPLAPKLHMADLYASYLMEERE